MRELSNKYRSNSSGETSGQDRDFRGSFASEGYQSLTEIANTVSLKEIFKFYGIRLDEGNRKTFCPFKSHKGGRENTPSFVFYPETNTYCCFGCRQGSSAVDFVSNMEKITKQNAAQKIIDKFEKNIDSDLIAPKEDFWERMDILMQYSDAVRDFRMIYNDDDSFKFIENNCSTFDNISKKHSLDNTALKRVVSILIDSINKYKV